MLQVHKYLPTPAGEQVRRAACKMTGVRGRWLQPVAHEFSHIASDQVSEPLEQSALVPGASNFSPAPAGQQGRLIAESVLVRPAASALAPAHAASETHCALYGW